MFNRKSRALTIKLIGLIVTGLVLIATSSHVWAVFKYGDALYFVKRQALFFIIGLFLMNLTSRIKSEKIHEHHLKFLMLCFISLVMVLIPGIGIQRNGSRSWFGAGSFLIQPSEFFNI